MIFHVIAHGRFIHHIHNGVVLGIGYLLSGHEAFLFFVERKDGIRQRDVQRIISGFGLLDEGQGLTCDVVPAVVGFIVQVFAGGIIILGVCGEDISQCCR